MKVSQLIKKLEDLLDSEGDFNVIIQHYPVKDIADRKIDDYVLQNINDVGFTFVHCSENTFKENICISTIETSKEDFLTK